MENMEAVKAIEGPYWHFSGVIGYFGLERDTAARLTVEAVEEGDFERAAKWARKSSAATEVMDRAEARYDKMCASAPDDQMRWIGWQAQCK